jgi:ribose transport system ATP-binding protein
MTADRELLRATGIEKSFSGVPVLRNVDLDLRRGEVHALMGENGAGKSTLVKILTGVVSRGGGTIAFDGRPVELASRAEAQALGISVIYQELSLVPTLSVTQNVLLGQEECRRGFLARGSMRRRVLELMRQHGFDLDPDAPVESLSLAERQTVEILKALSRRASLLVMDEPTASLSGPESERLFETIVKLRQQGVCILYISHRLEEVYRLADRVTVLRDGRQVATLQGSEIRPADVVRHMIGKDLTRSSATGRLRDPLGAPVLSVRHLGRAGAFQDVSFEAHAGEVLGIGGLVGSGRSELLECIFGIDAPDAGQLLFQGEPLPRSVRGAIARGIGLVPEDRRLQGVVPLLSIQRNVALASYDRIGPTRGLVSERGEAELFGRAVQLLDIRPARPDLRAAHLSGGNQQKVVLGKWLVRDLRMLLVDEPSVGIDVGVKDEIYGFIDRMASQGVAVIVVSSDLQELVRISHRILILREGRLIGEFRRGPITQEDVLLSISGLGDQARQEVRP